VVEHVIRQGAAGLFQLAGSVSGGATTGAAVRIYMAGRLRERQATWSKVKAQIEVRIPVDCVITDSVPS
jgi:hypothetical protein